MVTQLQPDVRAYLHGAEVIKRFVRVETTSKTYLEQVGSRLGQKRQKKIKTRPFLSVVKYRYSMAIVFLVCVS